MAGVYLHIPFCKQACHYCNFHFSTSRSHKNDFILALLKELALRRQYLGAETIETIYFGGGTPSLLDPAQLEQVLSAISQTLVLSPAAEITLEANPDDISALALQAWLGAGINRLSIGIQSFSQKDLSWMNRAHTAAQARDCITLAKEAGFSNINIDLIYGIPGMADGEWKGNLDLALSMGLPHFSCYALCVEPKTALAHQIASHQVSAISQDDQARQFMLLMEWMEEAGYAHYEISNFAKPGSYSRHNTAYWQGKPYLGLGPSAHSYNGHSRQWNLASNPGYIEAINRGELPFELETLTRVQVLNEYIMTSIRTLEGLDLSLVEKKFGEIAREWILLQSKSNLQTGRIVQENQRLVLGREGKLWADGIAASLFADEDLDIRVSGVFAF